MNSAILSDLIVYVLFGEFGKPFYNSVISTFCYQLATKEKTKVVDNIQLELLHVQDLAKEIYNVIKNSFFGDFTLKGSKISVQDARKILITVAIIIPISPINRKEPQDVKFLFVVYP